MLIFYERETHSAGPVGRTPVEVIRLRTGITRLARESELECVRDGGLSAAVRTDDTGNSDREVDRQMIVPAEILQL
jgi:hypothetical protein